VTTTVLVTVGAAAAGWDDAGWDEADADGLAVAVAGLREALAPADDALALVEAPPDGEGVRVPAWALDAGPLAGGVGVKIDGVDDALPPLQAETVTASSTAPAAERPAISHAPLAATGGVRHTFMNPPRMRVR
jgi:hypothetical protein